MNCITVVTAVTEFLSYWYSVAQRLTTRLTILQAENGFYADVEKCKKETWKIAGKSVN